MTSLPLQGSAEYDPETGRLTATLQVDLPPTTTEPDPPVEPDEPTEPDPPVDKDEDEPVGDAPQPTNVRALANSDNSVTVSWDPVPLATEYVLREVRTEGVLDRIAAPTVVRRSVRLAPGEYAYSVAAVVGGRESEPADAPRVTVGTTPPPPVDPPVEDEDPDIDPDDDEGLPAQADLRKSVERNRVGFGFDQPTTTGQFISGHWWAVPAAGQDGVTITEMTPAPTFGDLAAHGAMVDPDPGVAGQGYVGGASRTSYKPDLNRAKTPLRVKVGSTVIKSVKQSGSPWGEHSPKIAAVETLTVLAKVPPADALRPPYLGTDRIITVTDADLARIPMVEAPAGDDGPTLAQVAKRFANTQVNHRDTSWLGRYMHPTDSFMHWGGAEPSNYGADLARDNADGILRILTATKAERAGADWRRAVIGMLQAGVDWYGFLCTGERMATDGGHGVGRLAPLIFAAVVLDDDDIAAKIMDRQRNEGLDEFGHLYRSTKRNGLVLFGKRGSAEDYDNRRLRSTGSKDVRDPLQFVDGGRPGDYYQSCCTSRAYCAQALIARLLGDKAVALAGDVLLEYADRWDEQGAWAKPDDAKRKWSNGSLLESYHGNDKGGGFYGSGFQRAMIAKHRPRFGPSTWRRGN